MNGQQPINEFLLNNFTQFFFPNLYLNITFRDLYAPDFPHSSHNDVLSEYKLIYENPFNRTYDDENFYYFNGSCDSGNHSQALSSSFFQTAIYVMYITILLLALIGNGIVCFIVQSSPRMRTVTNYFIANLALGDILMSFFCIPFSFISMFVLQFWPFGAILCRIVNYSQAVSVLVSAYTLVAISIDRYIAIMWPLKPRITKRHAKYLIAGVWFVALMTALPIPIVSSLQQPPGWHKTCGKYICMENWPEPIQMFYYSMALTALQFIFPLLVLVFTYTRIAVAVWGKRPPGEAENSRDQRMARSKRKMIKMMVTVVIVFTICWLPFNMLLCFPLDETWDLLPYFWFAFHWLAMSHSCYNPIIYCYMNARFRSGFIQVLHHIPGIRRCRCIRYCARSMDGNNGTGLALTGTEETSQLHRVNTSTTYISTRRKIKLPSTQVPCSCAETALLR